MTRTSRCVARPIASLGMMMAVCAVHAQQIAGPESYSHYRGMSGLSGGGFGVLPDGSVGMTGAMSISTPIGFSLSDFHGAIGISSLSYDKNFSLVNIDRGSSTYKSGGVADGMFGIPLGRFGAFTATYELLSTELDDAFNFQYQAPIGGEKYGVSAGVIDAFNHAGAGADGAVGTPTNFGRSFFVAGTVHVSNGFYASLGKGDRRFEHGVFGNLSYGPTPRVKLIGEYDTFSWNYAIAYGLGNIPKLEVGNRHFEPVLSVGYIRGKNALVMLNVTL